jgi:hypothetical protein
VVGCTIGSKGEVPWDRKPMIRAAAAADDDDDKEEEKKEDPNWQ